VAVAAFALHELRYVLAPAQEVATSGHAYVPLVACLVVLLFAIAAGELALGLARARDDGTAEAEPRAFQAIWVVASAGLVAIFAAQELTEAALAGGPVTDPFAGGGLWALPLALLLGGLVAWTLRWAGGAVLTAARRRRRLPRRPGVAGRLPWRPLRPAASVLGRHLAGRAPPLTS
jgi:hypothetical protein